MSELPRTAEEPAVVSNDGQVAAGSEILRVENLVKHFPVRGGLLRREVARIHAVDGISFNLAAGESLGLVGESGCGKSTTGRMLVRLIRPTSGKIWFKDRDITDLPRSELRKLRRDIQIVFQDPFASLNPRMLVEDIVGEPLAINKVDRRSRRKRVAELLDQVGLPQASQRRLPHEFSGGQRQRIGIARALSLDPQLLVLDEPVSSLDVSVQAQIVNLFVELRERLGLTYVFIAHDLSVVRHIADRVAVMYLGKIVEIGARDLVYQGPAHPYTTALLSAVPTPDPEVLDSSSRVVLHGDVPNPATPPSGCRFRTRCWKAADICRTEEPLLRGQDRQYACHFPEGSHDDR